MNTTRFLTGLMMTAASLAALPAQAVVIDTFDTVTSRSNVNGTGASVGVVTTGAGILGGERDLFLEVHQDPSSFDRDVASFGIGGGRLAFSNDIGVASSLILTWDGVDGAAGVNAFGLGGIDFTDGGATLGLTFNYIADHAANVTLRLYQDASNYSQATFSLVGDGLDQSLALLFSSLTDVGGGANLTSVNAVQLIINNGGAVRNLDLQFSQLGSPAPASEPSALALISVMLLGHALLRRRRNTP